MNEYDKRFFHIWKLYDKHFCQPVQKNNPPQSINIAHFVQKSKQQGISLVRFGQNNKFFNVGERYLKN